MSVVWAYCKGKMRCGTEVAGDDADENPDEPKKGYTGCGYVQPVIRKEGLKLFAVYKKAKDEDDMVSTGGSYPDPN